MNSREKAIEAFGRLIDGKVELDSLCVTLPLVYKTDLSILEDHITQPTIDDAIKVVIKMQIKELENPKLLPHVLDTLHNVLTALKELRG